MDKRLLVNREWNTSDFENLRDSWYVSRDLISSFKSVKKVTFTDTSSSAGDWGGFFIQELNETKYVISFGQTNRYPYKGYNVFTTGVAISFKGEWDYEDLEKYYCDNFC